MTGGELVELAVTLREEHSWPMVPCSDQRPQPKAPCVSWKIFQTRLPTVAEMQEWARKFKPERWGIVTGALAQLVVIDFDGVPGRALMDKWGIVPHVRTGSGGFHLYVTHPGGSVPTLNAKSAKCVWPWPGLDIRGDGGFAIAMGKNENGIYVQLRELVPDPWESLPLEVREFLQNHGKQEKQPIPPNTSTNGHSNRGGQVDAELLIRRALDGVGSQGRNNMGFWLAGQLRDAGYSIGDAASSMQNYRSRCPSTNTKGAMERYSEHEIRASLKEAFSRPPREPWGSPTARKEPPVMAPDLGPEPPVPGDPHSAAPEPAAEQNRIKQPCRPAGKSAAELLDLKVPEQRMLIDGFLVREGVVLIVGSHKTGKTILAAQISVAVASGQALMQWWPVKEKGPVIVVEMDDPAGEQNFHTYFKKSPIPTRGLDIQVFTQSDLGGLTLGVEFLDWLEFEIKKRKPRLIVLDSYSALRGHRKVGGDIVKIEGDEISLLNRLCHKHDCVIGLLHHVSGGRRAMDWADQSGGTFQMGASSVGMIHISRFAHKLPDSAPERLIHGRPRMGREVAATVRFRESSFDYEMVLSGDAAPFYPSLRQIADEIGSSVFTPKTLYQVLGVARSTAMELLSQLGRTDGLMRINPGEYRLSPSLLKDLK
jgi:AAA domain/Bifunctional DNA primase/polymerase, N-terminal